jgi:YVTN family beta-propeller protein
MRAVLPIVCLAAAWSAFGSENTPVLRDQGPVYLSPVEIAVSASGSRLYVACTGSNELLEMDANSGAVLRRVRVGSHPKSVSLSPDGRQLFVANSWSDSVSVVDTASFKLMHDLPTGFEPNAAITDRGGRFLYTANRLSNDISVIDLTGGGETKRLLAGRGDAYLALSGDGQRIFSTHIYPLPGEFRTPPESEVTVIDTASRMVVARERLHNVAGVFHVVSPNGGRLVIAAEMRPKNLIPLAHVEHGWVFGNSLAVFGADIGAVVQVPLDELDRYFTPPFGLAATPDNRQLFVSTTGSDSVTAIDLPKMVAYIRAATPEQQRLMENDLSASAHYVTARIPVGHTPKGVALSPDGSRLYVANMTDDTISVIDTATHRVSSTFKLGSPAELTEKRRGERLFFSARFGFQGHFGCANCHIEATIDGLSWDLEPDGFGIEIVANRLLEDVKDTGPFKWNGSNPSLEMECGPRTEKYFYRNQSYSPRELADLVTFIKAIPLRPNRYRAKDGELTEQQERGRAIFERERTKNGAPIDEGNQCPVCHSGPHHTNQQLADVGTVKPTDRSPMLDVPQLDNVAMKPPYLHDGSANTLEEIWTVFNPHDKHGVSNDLAKDELNDLIEYLKTL